MTSRAALVDVFGTVLTVDLEHCARSLVASCGLGVEDLLTVLLPRAGDLMTGRLAPLHLFEAVLAGAGRDVAQAPGLVVRDAALLVEHAVVHHDTVPFLTALRQRGVRTALVSNCAPNARTLLEATGLDDLVDAVVLSCEMGSAKPDAGIYRAALTALDVPAGDALLVDDQAGYCEGAREVGIDAVRITRGQPPRPGEVASLLEVLDLF